MFQTFFLFAIYFLLHAKTRHTVDDEYRLCLRLPYHPSPKSKLREIYHEECEDIFRQEVGIERFTIAYSRAPNIGDSVTRTTLFQNDGEEVRTFLEGSN